MPNRVRSSKNFEDRRPGFVVTDHAGNQHIQAFDDTPGSVVSGGGGTTTGGGGGAHASTHEDGGPDEINVGGLSGELADPQPPKAHASSHYDGGSDEVDIKQLGGYSGDVNDVLRGDGTFAPASAAAGNWVPLALGVEPLTFVSDGAGHPIFVWYTP